MKSGKPGLVEAIRNGDWQSVVALSAEYVDLLKSYFIVGGMPEAVATWTRTQSYAKVRSVQQSVLSDYDDDFKKHAPKELLPKIRLLWNNIPAQLAKENKKFVYTALKAYRDFGAFKLYVHDVGLLGAMSALSPKVVLEGNELFTNFKGAMTEQFVQQELSARGLPIGYWTPDAGIAEVDFVVQGDMDVYPIEVKSALNTKAKSLTVYRKANDPAFAIKSSLKDYSGRGPVRSVPLYALGMRICKELGLEES